MSARPFSLPVLCLGLWSSCVWYEPLDADLEGIAAEVSARSGGTFEIGEAIARAMRDHPELRGLAARARAAGAATPVPLPVTGEWRGRNESIGAMLDPVALLGLGPRGAAIDAAEAKLVEAVAELAVGRWRVCADVAKAYRTDAALAALSVPDLQLNVDAFVRAGLASPVGAGQLQALQAKAEAERVLLDRLRADQRTRVRHLLGLGSGSPLGLAPSAEEWLEQPTDQLSRLLVRPDLRLSSARFEVADAEFRQAVADQYPSFQIGPNVSLRGDPLRAMGMLQLPIGAHGRARAASHRREAARADIEDRLLEAQREAALADDALRSAQALASAAAAALASTTAAFGAARIALEVEPDAFAEFVRSADVVLRATAEHRVAVVALAAAEVDRAVAYGWPHAVEEEER